MKTTGLPALSRFQVGFQTSITGIFVAVVLFVGLTLVYLSFNRVAAITRAAAGSFLETTARLSADRIDAKLTAVRDCLDVLRGLPWIQGGGFIESRGLRAVMASMLRNNSQLYNLYAGYDDGSFIEMDVLARAGDAGRERLGAPREAVFRLVIIDRSGGTTAALTEFLADDLTVVSRVNGPLDYDPRKRAWFAGAYDADAALLTDPYVFFASREPGYTLRLPILTGRRGVVAGDLPLGTAEGMIRRQQLGKSGLVFLFDDDGRVLMHPEMSNLLKQSGAQDTIGIPRLADVDHVGVAEAIGAWRASGEASQFFHNKEGRVYAAAFTSIEAAGPARLRLGVFAPLDEFYEKIEFEKNRLFAVALIFVLAALPIVLGIGSMLSTRLAALAAETDSIQKFEMKDTQPVHSVIREIDELGRSVFTMRQVVETFSNFVPKRLVQQLVQTGRSMSLGGERKNISVLFTDVENFTGLTEKADPARVMRQTSDYFAALSGVITSTGGTVDKFIGDAIMAIWNAPADDPNHVQNACAAALACAEANRALNARFGSEDWPAYVTRFGLHTGDAVVGNIGSPDRMNYTALGATVNLAARLEALNKRYGTTILVSAAVAQRAGNEFVFRGVDAIRPKGFTSEVLVFELYGTSDAISEGDRVMLREWETVFASLRRDPQQAAAQLAAFAARYPDDRIAQSHVEAFKEKTIA